ncbi:bifunctional methylenetetrahydrofolate dehydrogenase/cyclohydrolase, mitochondrial isoform X1 [Amyelois transitella]|uniref:bifunctional methylenetetrahydrofolate dehydrogenase/cyclohydrolase, mitochondrial isoform X1 n=2 Tax=Amyelois transitella TaxID=680683 RepID=UPI00298F5062|nr:bifunctional methylenetetrahydrofolate dehydrogenase/cyclohydrolase, mitochondrial isoform X1 [Amyelois transitella]
MRQIFCLRIASRVLTATMRSHTYFDSLGSPSIMAQILNGNAIAKDVKDELIVKIQKWVAEGHRPPSLKCIIVGDDPASHTYVRNKVTAAKYCGIDAETIRLDSDITEEFLLHKINELNNSNEVDGILIQLPVPDTMDERKICNAVSPKKDVDGFHIINVGQLCLDMPTIVPATALGVVELLKRAKIETHGRDAVVIGRSKNVGMPIAMMLHTDKRHESGLGMDATVTICHRHTPRAKLENYCRNADIIISATGIPNLIKADMVKPGATVVDVGITRITNAEGKNKLVGDVDYEEVVKVAGAITPVPGGVGPMTVAMLMQNTFQAAKMLRDKTTVLQ